jgi:hypothetical protein
VENEPIFLVKPSRVIKISGVLAAVGLFGWFGYRVATATDTYTYRINFNTLPATDEAFETWLGSQPGVRSASVTRSGDAVIVEYAMPWYSNAPRIDPVTEARRFGYGGFWKSTYDRRLRW